MARSDDLFCRARIIGNGTALLFILWVVFGALLTHRRPLLRWLHLASLVWGTVVEILPWACPLTPLENWLRVHAGGTAYQGGFLLHYLDALVYPDVPPGLLTACGVAVCLSISESTLRVSASARCRLVNRISRENGCKIVSRKLASSYVVIWRAREPVFLPPIFSHERLLAPP